MKFATHSLFAFATLKNQIGKSFVGETVGGRIQNLRPWPKGEMSGVVLGKFSLPMISFRSSLR
jgi:hypothetical protein